VTGESSQWPPAELRRILRQQASLDVAAVKPVGAGESRSAFWVTDYAGTVSVLKIMPDAPPEAAGHLRELDAVLASCVTAGTPHPGSASSASCPGWCTGSSPACPALPWTTASPNRTMRP
jgi:hypothetical protein